MEAKDIKAGERWKVEIEVVVERDGIDRDGDCLVRGLYTHLDSTGFVSSKHFVSKVEEPIAVGDRVRHTTHSTGEVLFLYEEYAFIRWNDSQPTTALIRNLERIND